MNTHVRIINRITLIIWILSILLSYTISIIFYQEINKKQDFYIILYIISVICGMPISIGSHAILNINLNNKIDYSII